MSEKYDDFGDEITQLRSQVAGLEATLELSQKSVSAYSVRMVEAQENIKELEAKLAQKGNNPPIPFRVDLDEDAVRRLVTMCSDLDDEPIPITLWVGEAVFDDGTCYGLNVSQTDYLEEGCQPLVELEKLQQESAEPVTLPSKLVVLNRPEGHPQQSEEELEKERQFASGWNAAIEEVEKLGNLFTTPLYTRSATVPAAVEGRTDAGAHTFKIPKMLRTPVTSWIDRYGMQRAIKVIDLQADNLRRLGNKRSEHDLREVAKALKAAITKENAVAERITLGW